MFKVDSLISFDTSMHLLNDHSNQDNEHIHFFPNQVPHTPLKYLPPPSMPTANSHCTTTWSTSHCYKSVCIFSNWKYVSAFREGVATIGTKYKSHHNYRLFQKEVTQSANFNIYFELTRAPLCLVCEFLVTSFQRSCWAGLSQGTTFHSALCTWNQAFWVC